MRTSEQIGKYIKQIRQQNNISVTDLAKKVDINKSTLSRYENGSRKIPMEDIAKFANALGVTPESILLEKTPQQETHAAHANKDEFTPEEWNEIENFMQWVRDRKK